MLQWTRDCRCFFDTLFSFPLAIYPEEGLLDPMVVVFLIWGISVLFSIVAEPTYIPTNSLQGFPFSPHSPQHLFFPVFLIVAILTGVWWSPFLVLILWWLEILSTFSCTCWPFGYFLWKKCLFNSFAHFLKWITCFCCWCCYWGCMSSLYILDISPLLLYGLQIFSPIP